MAKSNRMVPGLLFGAAVGVVTGLLLAPKPGKESRRVVAVQAGELREKASEYLSTMQRKMRGGNCEEGPEEIMDRQVGTPG